MTRAQSRAARALVDLSVRELAEITKVHRNTISAFESGKTLPNPSTIQLLRLALEAKGVEFLEDDGAGPGVRLKRVC